LSFMTLEIGARFSPETGGLNFCDAKLSHAPLG